MWTAPMQRKPRWEWVLLAAYVLVVTVVAMHHEPWRDETDAWLFARDADVSTIVSRSKYAGFPALWFLILAAPAKLGLPFYSQAIIHGAIAVAAGAILLFAAPFPLLLRGLLLFSYFPSYEYAVVVRSSGATMLLVWVVGALHARRRQRPFAHAIALGLLAQTSVAGIFLSTAVLVGIVIEIIRSSPVNWRRLAASGVAAAAIGVAVLQVLPPPDGNITGVVSAFAPLAPYRALKNAFLPTLAVDSPALILIPLVTFWLFSLRRDRPVLMTALTGLGLFAYLFALKYPGTFRHHGSLMLLVVLTYWMAGSEDEKKTQNICRDLGLIVLTATLAGSCVVAATKWRNDLRFHFSGSTEMAAYIRGSVPADVPLAGHSPQHAAVVLPLLPGRTMWFPSTGEDGSFMMYDSIHNVRLMMPIETATRRVRRHFGSRPHLLLLSEPLADGDCFGYRLVMSSSQRSGWASGERLYLYAPKPAPGPCLDATGATPLRL
jgi:hypothetical protein